MFTVPIDGKECEGEVSFFTAYLYEAEFRADMIQDLFGAQEFDDQVKTDKSGSIVSVDFTKTNWLALTKVLWAAIKTANPSTPGYSAWVKKTKGANLWLLAEVVSAEVADCFFRAEAAGEEAEAGQER